MNTITSPFRRMYYLHGILIFGTISVLIALILSHYMVKPEFRNGEGEEFLRTLMLLIGYVMTPIYAIPYAIACKQQERARQ